MEVGLFLDVDGVLNHKAVNLQYAQLLGVENKLVALENRFANREITTDQFNDEFVPLFREAHFTEEFARKNFTQIQMRSNASELIAACPNTFLVTSGPSYFIDAFVEKHKIPPDRVVCSRYCFDDEGLLSRKEVQPANSNKKGTFVKERASKFDVSIGVGDTEQDIEFLSHCNLRILMSGNRLEYLSVRELQPIVDLVEKFQKADNHEDRRYGNAVAKLHAMSDYRNNIFIMTPFRNDARYRETIRAIRDALQEVGLRGWTADEQNFDQQLWDNLQIYLIGCRAGIAVFTHDEPAGKDPNSQQVVFNPNVALEVGFMLSRRKPVLFLKERTLLRLPTDVLGALYEDFDLENSTESIRRAVHRWVGAQALKPVPTK